MNNFDKDKQKHEKRKYFYVRDSLNIVVLDNIIYLNSKRLKTYLELQVTLSKVTENAD